MDDRRQCRCGWRWRVGWFLSHWTWNSDLCTWYRPPTQQPTNTLKLHNLVGNVWNVLWGPRNVEPNIITATKYTFWVNFTKPGRVSSSCVMTTHLLLLKTVSNTGGSLFTIPRTLLPGVVAAFSSGQWSLLYLRSFTDNSCGACVPWSNTAGAAGAGEGCVVLVWGMSLDCMFHNFYLLASTRRFVKRPGKECTQEAAWWRCMAALQQLQHTTHVGGAKTFKEGQPDSVLNNNQLQSRLLLLLVHNYRIQSTTISHHTSWILMMVNIIAIVDCSSIKCPAACFIK